MSRIKGSIVQAQWSRTGIGLVKFNGCFSIKRDERKKDAVTFDLEAVSD
tara:strand:+ start:7764 stop:7910 length:147 start_codon:yes stop_codon:yes gene_type:complete